jgi:Predicted membrane protein (DUF2306)
MIARLEDDTHREIGSPRWPLTALRWSSICLVSASWLSAAIFGMYILAFYLGALPGQHLNRWNDNLPGLYSKHSLFALVTMSAHLATGSIILLLGPVQLIGTIRSRWPRFHRWCGRLYVLTAFLAGIGGLGFIVSRGTIGGAPMNAGFGLYGLLMILAATETYRHARRRQFEIHRAWAIRLFALAIGSWLYRMDYGFWLIAAHGLGHRPDFRGPFDIVMAFFFYVPNLLLAELFIRARRMPPRSGFRFPAAAVLSLATITVLIGTYYFARYYWGPGILGGFGG